ncbi:methyltransferase domain-containing protein [Kaistella flava (ex Peng et al. 2021)]|uniref:Methyltransferase domain-containing protein n=1 Tax=Kaistella flava (ex Peng et al. 2021) TaxID=2038776 RepID=A0A7M2YC67_9FLAO|nr:methyltransferase domain-containing protein [Kaistella flava (ex Peng et al. 2021)]QOW11245.1 methyltransferase domain-containing protein [Kaistella flava (ex Peng et al. 2021)]
MENDFSCNKVPDQNNPDKEFWESRWDKKETGWDIGFVSPAIEKYILQHQNKESKILIPGCGNAYEAEFLWNLGFRNITVLDIAPSAVEILKEKFKDKKGVSVICGNFFEHQGKYDLMIEQTFFCAIAPSLRNKYAEKASELLNENGRIIGVMFNRTFEKVGPPFGGSIAEYQLIFEKYFEIEKMEECYNSIQPRKGSEIFINLKKIQNENKHGQF